MFNRLYLWTARIRRLQPLLNLFGRQSATYPVIKELKIEIPLQDLTGPGFYLNYGGPQAFYHYEEQEKTEIIRALPLDGVFLDIGANIGLFSVYVSKLLPLSQCFAFEPNPVLAQCIRKTIGLSSLDRISVEEICLSDHDGVTDFYLHSRNSGGGSILMDSIQTPERGKKLEIQCKTLDSWMRQRPNLPVHVIKIDVQGAEPLVLKGAQECITRYRPTVLAEIADQDLNAQSSEWSAILDFFTKLGYRVRISGTLRGVPADQIGSLFESKSSRNRHSGYANYVFEPTRQ